MAGPIVRARGFFRDLYAWKAPGSDEIKYGAFLIVLGPAKKVALADNFALISDRYFNAVASQRGEAADGNIPFVYFQF